MNAMERRLRALEAVARRRPEANADRDLAELVGFTRQEVRAMDGDELDELLAVAERMTAESIVAAGWTFERWQKEAGAGGGTGLNDESADSIRALVEDLQNTKGESR